MFVYHLLGFQRPCVTQCGLSEYSVKLSSVWRLSVIMNPAFLRQDLYLAFPIFLIDTFGTRLQSRTESSNVRFCYRRNQCKQAGSAPQDPSLRGNGGKCGWLFEAVLVKIQALSSKHQLCEQWTHIQITNLGIKFKLTCVGG